MSDFEPPFEDLILEWPNDTLEVYKREEGPVTTLTWGQLADEHTQFYDPSQPRDARGRWSGGGGGGAMKYSARPEDGLPLPPVPGTIPIPEGTVRLFHQTYEEMALKIREEGIEARQPVEGPWGVWGAEPSFDDRGNAKGFYGRADEKPTVEYAVPQDDLDKWGGPLKRNVAHAEVLAVHMPWHKQARYIMSSPGTLKAVLAGEFDDYKETEGGGVRETVLAIRWVKKQKQLSKLSEEVTEFFDPSQPRGEDGRWVDGGGSGGRAKIGGARVKTKGKFSPSAATKARLKMAPDVYELDPSEAGVFHTAVTDLKKGNKFASSVYVYDKDEYAQMRTFMTDDGKTGFAIKGDEVVSVFAARDTQYKGATASHLATAVEQGARRLDCYDTVLPKIYAEAGFEPVSRVKWNDDYAPDGWDYELYGKYNGGRPDVVAMVYNPAKVGSRYEGGGDYAADYDEMMSVAQSRAAGK